jgi:hypothetical protein
MEDVSGVQIHTLHSSATARFDRPEQGTDRLSSEPDRRMSPSSDQDNALTQLLVSLQSTGIVFLEPLSVALTPYGHLEPVQCLGPALCPIYSSPSYPDHTVYRMDQLLEFDCLAAKA